MEPERLRIRDWQTGLCRALWCAVLTVAPCIARAQVATIDTEPNNQKRDATPATSGGPGMAPGDTIRGVTTGTNPGGTGSATPDYFRVRTQQRPPAIYRHRLTLTSATPGHTGSIRGRAQRAGSIIRSTDVDMQVSQVNSNPPRTNQWYGFGKGEEVYYRVTGTSATNAEYVATLETVAVPPIVLPQSLGEGDITISTLGQTSIDTDLWVYDAQFRPVVRFGNDDESQASGGPGTSEQSRVIRSLGPGTYYLAIANFNLANNQPSPSDDRFRDGNVLDFPGAIVNSSPSPNLDCDVTFQSGSTTVPVTATRTGPFDVVWIQFEVVANPVGSGPRGRAEFTPDVVTVAPLPPTGGDGQCLLAIEVVPGLNPPATILSVTADLRSLGLGPAVPLADDGLLGDLIAGDFIYSLRVTPASNATLGPLEVPFRVEDDLQRTVQGFALLEVRPALIDLGSIDVDTDGMLVQDVIVPRGAARWFRFRLECTVAEAQNTTFDILTNTSPLSDTELALYRADGTRVAQDDDDGSVNWSALSFGLGTLQQQNAPDLPSVISDGRDGPVLDAGTYFLAVADFDTAFVASGFELLENGQDTGAIRVTFHTDVNCPGGCDSIDFNNDGIEQDPTDLEAFFSVYSGGVCVPVEASCNDLDFNNDGIEQDPTDLEAFFAVYSGQPCPT